MPYARAEGGLGSAAGAAGAAAGARARRWRRAWRRWRCCRGRSPSPPPALAAAVVALAGAWRFARDLGGVTGDTLGAVVKLAELTTYVAAAAWAARP